MSMWHGLSRAIAVVGALGAVVGLSAGAAGACVRVAGKGSVDKGKIAASTVNITATSSNDCARPGGANGSAPGSGPSGAGSFPGGGSIPNGSNPPNGSTPRNGNTRPRTSGMAFGSVQSVKGSDVVVNASTFQRH